MSTESDLQGDLDSSAADASNQQNTIATITSSVKTARQVDAEFNHYRKYGKGFPKKLTLHSGSEWAKNSLEAYAKDNAKQWGAEAIGKIASAYGYEGYVPSEIPTNEKEAADALVNIACVAASDELGVDPRLAKVTVEAVIDGKLDKNDCESIGKTAGSIAGAAICQAYGIPAPIGAFLGGELGGFIGGEIADIFGMSAKAHREWLAKQRQIVAQILQKAEDACAHVRQGYWTTFDAYVAQAETTWENLEIKAGHRFDVRWFDKSPTPQFLQYVQQQASRYQGRVSAESCDLICADGLVLQRGYGHPMLPGASAADIAHYQAQCQTDFRNRVMRRYHVSSGVADLVAAGRGGSDAIEACSVSCLADYGCLYPDMTPYARHPQLRTLASPARVCSAYYALGFPWYPAFNGDLMRSWGLGPSSTYADVVKAMSTHQGQYRTTVCTLPAATARAVESKKYRKLWIDWLGKMIELEERKVASLNSASVRLFGDLTQTAAIVAVQRQMSDAKTRAALRGLGGDDVAVTTASSWVNNATLAAGLGWLAYNARGRR